MWLYCDEGLSKAERFQKESKSLFTMLHNLFENLFWKNYRNSITYLFQYILKFGHGQNFRESILKGLTVLFFCNTPATNKYWIFSRFVTKLTHKSHDIGGVWTSSTLYIIASIYFFHIFIPLNCEFLSWWFVVFSHLSKLIINWTKSYCAFSYNHYRPFTVIIIIPCRIINNWL